MWYQENICPLRVNTTKLRNIRYTLVASGLILWSLERANRIRHIYLTSKPSQAQATPCRRAPAFPRGRSLMMKQKGKDCRKRAKNLEPHAHWRAGRLALVRTRRQWHLSTTSISERRRQRRTHMHYNLQLYRSQGGC